MTGNWGYWEWPDIVWPVFTREAWISRVGVGDFSTLQFCIDILFMGYLVLYVDTGLAEQPLREARSFAIPDYDSLGSCTSPKEWFPNPSTLGKKQVHMINHGQAYMLSPKKYSCQPDYPLFPSPITCLCGIDRVSSTTATWHDPSLFKPSRVILGLIEVRTLHWSLPYCTTVGIVESTELPPNAL